MIKSIFLLNKLLYYSTVAAVFLGNILVLLLSPFNIGFGNLNIGLFGIVLMLVGFIFWLGGMISLGTGFSLFPQPKKLVNTGLYRFTKHPIYLGMTLALSGLALAKGSSVGLLFTLLITTPLNIYRARQEEKALKAQFGVKYNS